MKAKQSKLNIFNFTLTILILILLIGLSLFIVKPMIKLNRFPMYYTIEDFTFYNNINHSMYYIEFDFLFTEEEFSTLSCNMNCPSVGLNSNLPFSKHNPKEYFANTGLNGYELVFVNNLEFTDNIRNEYEYTYLNFKYSSNKSVLILYNSNFSLPVPTDFTCRINSGGN